MRHPQRQLPACRRADHVCGKLAAAVRKKQRLARTASSAATNRINEPMATWAVVISDCGEALLLRPRRPRQTDTRPSRPARRIWRPTLPRPGRFGTSTSTASSDADQAQAACRCDAARHASRRSAATCTTSTAATTRWNTSADAEHLRRGHQRHMPQHRAEHELHDRPMPTAIQAARDELPSRRATCDIRALRPPSGRARRPARPDRRKTAGPTQPWIMATRRSSKQDAQRRRARLGQITEHQSADRQPVAASGACPRSTRSNDEGNREQSRRRTEQPMAMLDEQVPRPGDPGLPADRGTGCSRRCRANRARPCRRRTSSPARRPRSAETSPAQERPPAGAARGMVVLAMCCPCRFGTANRPAEPRLGRRLALPSG